jgi:hypothetical protein
VEEADNIEDTTDKGTLDEESSTDKDKVRSESFITYVCMLISVQQGKRHLETAREKGSKFTSFS